MQLESHQNQVNSFIARQDQVNESVQQLIEQVNRSDEELHSWLVSDDAATLWRWPN